MVTPEEKKSLFPLFVCLTVFYLFIFTVIFQSEAIASEVPDFYYYYDEKIPLDISEEMVAVCFDEAIGKEDKEALLTSDTALENLSDEVLPFGLILAVTKQDLNKEDIKQAVERLNELPEVKYSTPVFQYRNMKLVLMDKFVVRFNPEVTEQAIQIMNSENEVAIVSKSPYRHNRYVLRVMNTKTKNAVELANIYNVNSQIRYATPIFLVLDGYQSTHPNDTYFSSQWALDNTGQDPPAGTPGADIDAPEGWDISTGGPDVVIAIIDSGTDIYHEDLNDNIWVNEAELNGEPNVDDDDPCNGYVDDIYGWDLLLKQIMKKELPAFAGTAK
jgi:ribosomal protein L23